MSFASHGDNQPYHGWFIGYNATNVAQMVGVYNTTPNGAEGGFWDGGGLPFRGCARQYVFSKRQRHV